MRFEGKVVVVTGAAQGIGRAVADRIAAESGTVVLVDRADLVHEAAQNIRATGSRAHSVTADLEQYDGALAAMSAAHSEFGRIDVLINNVGGTIWAKPYEEYSADEIEQEIRRSLAMELAPHGIRVAATAPGRTDAPVRAVKRGPEPQTEQEKGWYRQIVDQTIDSSLLKRYGTLQEQASAITFLASDEASYITGSTLAVAGGDLG